MILLVMKMRLVKIEYCIRVVGFPVTQEFPES